jgi:hypothetical protein
MKSSVLSWRISRANAAANYAAVARSDWGPRCAALASDGPHARTVLAERMKMKPTTNDGPDLTLPGSHWTNILRAVASDQKITLDQAADWLCNLRDPRYHKAIRGSVLLEREQERKLYGCR